MPDPCAYDNEDDFHSDCVAERQRENPDKSIEQSNAVCYALWADRDCKSGELAASPGPIAAPLVAFPMREAKKTVHKQGEQSAADPFEFVMSTDTVDRAGDIVEQDWKLKNFRRNPVALWQHNSRQPIGFWKNVRVEGNRLLGRLELAARGTSDLIDTIHSLIEQRIIRAVSVGFIPGKWEALDEENPWDGMRLSDNELLECSLVSVPANQEALSLAKDLDPATRRYLFVERPDLEGRIPPGETAEQTRNCAAQQLGLSRSRVSDDPRTADAPGTGFPKTTTMKPKLSEKIEARQAEIVTLRDELTVLVDEIEGEITDEQQEQMDELELRLSKASEDLVRLQKAEEALALRATQVATTPDTPDAPAPARRAQRKQAMGGNYVALKPNKPQGHLALAYMATLIKAHTNPSVGAVELAQAAYRDTPELETLLKQNPADMTTPGWATELVRDTWGEFLALVRDQSIYPRVPGMRLEFGMAGTIQMPVQGGRGQLAGGFVAEGAPLPVRDGALSTVAMAPKEMGVISVFTKKLGMHSVPQIEGLIRDQILADTAEVLDASFLDNNARTAVRPAGLLDPTSTGAGNIVAATGGTVGNVNTDLTGVITRHLNARAGIGGVIVVHPIKALYLQQLQDAASGTFPFQAQVAAGTLLGYPLIQNSRNMASDALFLIGGDALAHASSYAPMVDVSDQPTIVFGDPAEHIVDSGLATTQDVRSAFQANLIAVRMTLGLDWLQVRPDTIQALTGLDTHWV